MDRDKGLPLRGLRIQIILWIVLPVTLLLIGIAFTGVYGHERAMQDLVEERDQALAQVAANQVADRLRQRASALQALAVEQPFHHPGQSAQQARLAQAGTLDGLFVAPIALLGQDGTPLPGVGPLPAWTGDPHLAALAERTLQTGRLEMSPLFNAAWGQDVFLLAVPVQAGGTVHGLLAAPVALPDLGLEAVLAQVQAGQQGAAYVVDASGAVLARYPAGRARQSLDGHTGLAIALQEPAAGATLCDAPDGERMVLGYALVPAAVHGAPDTGWRVLVEEPWQAVTSPVLRYSQVMPAVAVLGVVVSLLALYYGVRSIVRPLQLLGSRAERLAWGEFEAVGAPVGGVQEIEELRRTLDHMARRIESQQRGMHDYIAAMTLGQEEERKRLARELHDDTAQALIALNQQVEMAQNLLAADPERAARRLAEVRSLLAGALEGIRRFSRDLRPIYLEDLGFIPALEALARQEPQDRAGEPDGAPRVHFSVAGPVRRLPPDLELAAYRIVQEALNNALQHARASQVRVQVQFEPEHLVLSVRDDGRGFVPPALPDALPRQGHFGLMGIQERTLLYGGQLALHAAPGQGTEVQVRLPYPAGAGTSPEQGRSAQGRE